MQISAPWERYYATLRQLPRRLKKPVPFVVRALPSLKRRRTERVLDLGCGVGRHCIYLAGNSFAVVGVDISSSALAMAKKWADGRRLKNVAFLQAAMAHLPFCENEFDAVISVSVLHHATKKKIATAFAEIFRVMRSGGVFLANLASVNDPRFGEGERIEENTFKILETFEEKWFEETHHFFSKKETTELLACFSRYRIEALGDRYKYWKVVAFK